MSRQLIRQLKMLKHGEANPSEEWLKSNRALLLAQINNTVSASDDQVKIKAQNVWSLLSIFLPRNFVYNVVRPIVVLLLVFGVGTSGWITTVDAAYEALPGDWLYPAKRAAEKTQMAVATMMGSGKTETKLHVEFAKRRATEAKKIIAIANIDPTKKNKVAQAVVDLKNEIKNVGDNLDKIKTNPGDQSAAGIAKDIDKNTDQIKNVLQEVKDDLLISTSTADKALSKEVTEAKEMVKDVGVKAVELMVSKHLEGDNSVTQEEIKQTINKTLQNVANEMGESKQSMQSASLVVNAVKTEAKEFAQEAKQNPLLATSTKQLTEKITDVSQQTKEATAQTNAVKTEVDKKITEARGFLDSGDLAKAVDKMKETSETAKQMEKITDNTIQSVQSVAPVMSVVKDASVSTSSPAIIVIVTTTPAEPVKVIVTSTPMIVQPKQ